MTADGYSEIVRDDCMEFSDPARAASPGDAPSDPAARRPYRRAVGRDGPDVLGGVERHRDRGRRGPPQLGRQSPALSSSVGRVVAERVAVEVAEDDVRQQVDRALYPGVAPERKLVAFVTAFKRSSWDLDPYAFEMLYDVPGDPTLAVAELPGRGAGVDRRRGAPHLRSHRERQARRLAERTDEEATRSASSSASAFASRVSLHGGFSLPPSARVRSAAADARRSRSRERCRAYAAACAPGARSPQNSS